MRRTAYAAWSVADTRRSRLGGVVIAVCVLSSVPVWGMDEPSGPAAPAVTGTAGEPNIGQHVLVEGQLTDHVGAGHAGIRVTLRRKAEDGGPGDLLAETETNEFGDFVLRSDQRLSGDVILTCQSSEYATLTRELHLDSAKPPPFVFGTLEGKYVLTGRVRDALEDRPLPEARVKLKAGYREWFSGTDEQGRFEIRGVLPGRGALTVEADGYGREYEKIADLAVATDLIVELKPERIVRIRIMDEQDQPIPKATVECYDRPRDDMRMAVTDDAGEVEFRGIHFDARKLAVRLGHEDYVSSHGFDRHIETPADNAKSLHEFTLKSAGRISGRVVDASSGDAVNGARVIVGPELDDDLPRDWTDYEGRYEITGVPPGQAVITAHLSGYAPELATAVIRPAETSAVDFELREGRTVTGVIRTEDDEPAVGVMVAATKWRGYATLGLRAMTGHDGRFTIHDAPADAFELGIGHPPRATRMVDAGADVRLEMTVPKADLDATGIRRAVKVGDPAPSVRLTALDGNVVDIGASKGKVVLLEFWATWCAPCIEQLPELIKVHERFGARKDFLMIGISLDADETPLKEMIGARGIKWPQVVGEQGGVPEATSTYGVNGIPALFVIDRAGAIVAVDPHGKAIHDAVAAALEPPEAP